MVSLARVEEQLKKIGSGFRFWGRAEIRELTNILMNDEIIAGCVNGRYEGGFALLCVTNHRLLLVDRKPMFLTLEDLRFDMITELDFAHRLLNSTVRIMTPNRALNFTSWSHHRLRKILNYTQQRVMETRQPYITQQFQPSMIPARAHFRASQVGGLAIQGDAQTTIPLLPYPNPYTNTPLMMRRRRLTNFF